MQEAAVPLRVMIVAGEASGDLHGAGLVQAMRARDPKIGFVGIGGPRMQAAGVHLRFSSERLAVVGLTEVFSRLPDISKGLAAAKGLLRRTRPALLILIDFPDFNLRVAAFAKKLNIPVLYYISPQIWAWRRGRAAKISRRVDHMAVILPFEKEFYEGYQVPVTFVGHPLLDQGAPVERGMAPRVPGGSRVVGLLPGSRMREIERHLPVMMAAAERIAARLGNVCFRVSLAPGIDRDRVVALLAPSLGKVEVELVAGGADKVYRHCHLAVAVSGTVTLEAALACTPMVIIYRVSPLSYQLGKRLVRVKYMGLINLIAGREVVPELVQHEVCPETICQTACRILCQDSRLEKMREELATLTNRLGGPGASDRVAQIALNLITGRQPDLENGRGMG